MDERSQQKKVRSLWIKACKHEGINPNSKFVIFGKDNPFDKEYNLEVGKYLGMIRKV